MMNDRFDYINSSSMTDAGLVRGNNEDAVAVLATDGCFFVTDGMGGGDEGEIASQIVHSYIRKAIEGSAPDSPGLRKYNIQQAVHWANRQIRQYAEEHFFKQMGATLALLLLDPWQPDRAMVCHVGDSRVYCFRQGKLFCITRDHTVGAELARQKVSSHGTNSLGDHQKSALSHILTRSIGTSNVVMTEWDEVMVLPEDIFLVCTDGVTTMLNDSEICAVLKEKTSASQMIENLGKLVRAAGAKDNYSMICCIAEKDLPKQEDHDKQEQTESDYLLKIAEERIDYV